MASPSSGTELVEGDDRATIVLLLKIGGDCTAEEMLIKIVEGKVEIGRDGKFDNAKLDTLVEVLDGLAEGATPTMVVSDIVIDVLVVVPTLVVTAVVKGPKDDVGTVIVIDMDREMEDDVKPDGDDKLKNGVELDSNV